VVSAHHCVPLRCTYEEKSQGTCWGRFSDFLFSTYCSIPLQLPPPYDAETKALVGNECYHMVIITYIRTEWQGDWSGMLGSALEAGRLTTQRRCEGDRSVVLLSAVAIWRATLFWPTAAPRPPKRCGCPLRMLGAIPAVEKATLEVDAWPDYTVTTERPPSPPPHLAPFVTYPSTSHFRIFPAICLVIPFIEILALISVASEKRLGLVDIGRRGINNNRQRVGSLKRRRSYRLVWDFSPWPWYSVCLRLSDRLIELNLTTFPCLQVYSVWW
jgi:hypothetical protein